MWGATCVLDAHLLHEQCHLYQRVGPLIPEMKNSSNMSLADIDRCAVATQFEAHGDPLHDPTFPKCLRKAERRLTVGGPIGSKCRTYSEECTWFEILSLTVSSSVAFLGLVADVRTCTIAPKGGECSDSRKDFRTPKD